jgi:hypothetical protein
MQSGAHSTTLVRTWVPKRSFLGYLGLVLAFCLVTAAAILPAGWRLQR